MLAKKNKDFEQADNIRNELLKKGIKLIDTREGTSYEIVKD
jgi:cysteinyl-tRNA synthetase